MLVETSENSDKLVYNSIGGNIHFLVFVGDKNPEKTLQKYHDFIGNIHIPPFWALGWHQCRWGYKNINVFKQVI
jgi:alpha-glucosidase (family GH31 glycosyl hydrolase)